MSVNARLAELNRANSKADETAAAEAQARAAATEARLKAAEESRTKAREARAKDAQAQAERTQADAEKAQDRLNADVEAAFGAVDDEVRKLEKDAVEALGENADAFDQANARYLAAMNLAKVHGFDDPILEARADLGRARAYLEVVQHKAAKAEEAALRLAGDNPVRKAQAKAAAATKFAVELGQAEIEANESSMRFDRLLIDVAFVAKVTASRINAAEKRLAEREKLLADPRRKSNPFLDPPPWVLAKSQWNELSDAAKARASREGVRVVPDADPKFTKADIESILDKQGSSRHRLVFTRSELRSIEDPAEQIHAGREGIIVDDE